MSNGTVVEGGEIPDVFSLQELNDTMGPMIEEVVQGIHGAFDSACQMLCRAASSRYACPESRIEIAGHFTTLAHAAGTTICDDVLENACEAARVNPTRAYHIAQMQLRRATGAQPGIEYACATLGLH